MSREQTGFSRFETSDKKWHVISITYSVFWLGILNAIQAGMGKNQNTTLIYAAVGIIVGMLFLGFAVSSPQFLGKSRGTPGSANSLNQVSQGRAIPRSAWKKLQKSAYRNTYEASPSYVNNLAADDNTPLVASTTFNKKDKKKKNKKKTTIADKESSSSSRSRRMGLSNTPEFLGAPTLGGGIAAGNANAAKKNKQQDEEENLDQVEYWETPIFENQDPAAVDKLISSYQIRKVSTNVFYTVVEEMTHDERLNLRQFGLKALTAAPGTKSFELLTWLKHNDTNIELRTSASNQVATYTDVGRLGYVISALKTNDPATTKSSIEAMKVLTESTKRYDELRALQSTGPDAKRKVNVTQLTARYEQALTALQTHTQSPDAAVKAEAQKTIDAINQFITT